MGFSRQEYWSGLPFPSPGDLPNPGIKPRSPALQTDALPSEPPGKLALNKRIKWMTERHKLPRWDLSKRKKINFFNAHPRPFLFLFCLFLSTAPWNQNYSPTLWLGRPRLEHEVVQLRSHTMSVVDVTFKTPGLSGWIPAMVPWMGMGSRQTPWTKISYLLQQVFELGQPSKQIHKTQTSPDSPQS